MAKAAVLTGDPRESTYPQLSLAALLKNIHWRPKTAGMDKPKITVADVINSVGETLRTICNARGIELKDVDDELIDSLLSNAFEEYLADETNAGDSLNVPHK